MPAVVTYWQLPSEEEAFLEYVCSTGQMLAFADHGVDHESEVGGFHFLEYLEKHDPDSVLFGPSQHLSNYRVKQCEEAGHLYYMGPELIDSCVLAYTRPRVRDTNKLTLSNLAGYWTYFDERRSSVVEKETEFVSWAKSIFAWLRTNTPYWHKFRSYRLTERAKELLESGQLDLVEY